MENITASNLINTTETATFESAVARTALFGTLIALQILVMIGMGAVTTIQEIWKNIKKPTGILISLVTQFGLLPLCAFGLITVLQLSPEHSMSAMIVACCPGGTISNLHVYLCSGDVPLSIVLTTVNTALAVGIMPFNLWIYSRPWQIAHLQVPYERIATTLACILAPLAVGMIIKVCVPKIAPIIGKVTGLIGLILTLVTLVLQHVVDPDSYTQPWQLWFLACSIPTIGFTIGYLAAFTLRQSHNLCRTIGVETGIQSISLSATIIMTSFPPELHHQLLPFAFMYGIYITAGGMMLAIVVRLQKCLFKDTEDTVQKAELTSFLS